MKKENIKYKYAFGQRIPDDATRKVKPTKIEKEDEALEATKSLSKLLCVDLRYFTTITEDLLDRGCLKNVQRAR